MEAFRIALCKSRLLVQRPQRLYAKRVAREVPAYSLTPAGLKFAEIVLDQDAQGKEWDSVG
jgi:hypothetical protein